MVYEVTDIGFLDIQYSKNLSGINVDIVDLESNFFPKEINERVSESHFHRFVCL